MHVKTSSPTALTVKITADELAEVIAQYCRDHMGLMLPEQRKCMLSLSVDGQPARRIKLTVKW